MSDKRKYILAGAAFLTLLPAVSAFGPRQVAAADFAAAAFKRVWVRTDKLVADNVVKRSYYWGRLPATRSSNPMHRAWAVCAEFSTSTRAAWR